MDYQTSTAFALHRQREAELVRSAELRRRAREASATPTASRRDGVVHTLLHALDSIAAALHLHRSHVARPTH